MWREGLSVNFVDLYSFFDKDSFYSQVVDIAKHYMRNQSSKEKVSFDYIWLNA